MTDTRSLRVLQVTTTDYGGAGVACLRLHHTLRELGTDSRVFVQHKKGTDGDVIETGSRWMSTARLKLDRLPLRLYPDRKVFAWWSVNWVGGGPRLSIGDWRPDIIHAHWIGDGYVPIEWLAASRKPVVWTMHDMWPFTGGCHYAFKCQRYESGCGACPQLASSRPRDLSSRSAVRKAAAWRRLRGIAVSPSPWLADLARTSFILRNARIESIPNGLNGNVFRSRNRLEARRRLGLQDDEKVILTGAVGAVRDERKGFSLLVEALQLCKSRGQADQWRLLVFGASEGPAAHLVGVPATYCGTVGTEEELVTLYEAADVFVLPSLQDNLPNTVVESLACGTPVVGFRAGGLATMIVDGKTGRLAEPFLHSSLADALAEAMNNAHRWRNACRQEFEGTYAWPGPAHKYLSLYNELLDRRGPE